MNDKTLDKLACSFSDVAGKEQGELRHPSQHLGAVPEQAGRIGLALSGGGIRSATFSLGVLQALAAADRLASFDYLSTVSGGGYIGSWLSAWIQREGLASVQSKLSRTAPESAGALRSSEPEAVSWLRRYSNYLAPRVGLLSTDALTLMAVWIRNLFLNLVVIVSFLAAILLLPKVLIVDPGVLERHRGSLIQVAAFLGLFVTPMAIAWHLSQAGSPPSHWREWLLSTPGVLVTVLLPGTLAAITGSVSLLGSHELDKLKFVMLVVILICLCAGIWAARYARGRVPHEDVKGDVEQAGIYVVAAAAAAISAVGILLLAATLSGLSSTPARQAATLLTVGPPALLFAFGIGGSVFVGIVGRAYFERSREWWGRMNALFFMVATLWLGITFTSFFIPALVDWVVVSLPGWLKILTGAGWIGSLIAALLAPKKTSLSTPAQFNLMRVLNVAALVFIAGFIILISVSTERLVAKAASITPTPVTTLSQFSLLDVKVTDGDSRVHSEASVKETKVPHLEAFIEAHMDDMRRVSEVPIHHLPLYRPYFLASLASMLGIFALFGWRVDVNKFSLHNLYKNRLIRCYLGASNTKRRAQPFTGFDDGDDPPLNNLKQGQIVQRPFHIINTTLNLSQGKNLAWQERKGASFVLTPLFCGYALSSVQGDSTEAHIRDAQRFSAGGAVAPAAASSKVVEPDPGYRSTKAYASDDPESKGFTLGMAMATSGAAASPNMGPATRPALAFVMTLFNVRLGRWSPNTAKTEWQRGSPRFGIFCFLAELFGFSDEKSNFVYLSDGGHFDNMGLYELVRRKCSTIWLVDAAADFSRTFEDLGRSIRQCRIDFGVEISLDMAPVRNSAAGGLPSAGFTAGEIKYGPGHPPGTLIYIKPTLCAKNAEPEDLLAYAANNPTFPQQSTANQFYDESEFESYRKLGAHIAAQCISTHQALLPKFIPAPPVKDDDAPPPLPPPILKLFRGLALWSLGGILALGLWRAVWLSCGWKGWLVPNYQGVTKFLSVVECGLPPSSAPVSLTDISTWLPQGLEVWLWLDNVLVTVYSALFIVGWRWFLRLGDRPWAKRLFPVLVGTTALGAACGYVENFTRLGGLYPTLELSVATIVLCAFNTIVLVALAVFFQVRECAFTEARKDEQRWSEEEDARQLREEEQRKQAAASRDG